MTEDEALALMVDGGFQEYAEARAKYDRARLTVHPAVDLLHRLARDVGHRARGPATRGRRVGRPAGAAAVPEPGVVGGFGDTPGFVYRQHLESVISHGSPPTSLLRRILLG